MVLSDVVDYDMIVLAGRVTEWLKYHKTNAKNKKRLLYAGHL